MTLNVASGVTVKKQGQRQKILNWMWRQYVYTLQSPPIIIRQISPSILLLLMTFPKVVFWMRTRSSLRPQIIRPFRLITDPSYKTLASTRTSSSLSYALFSTPVLPVKQAMPINAIKWFLQYLFLCPYVLSLTFFVCETMNSYRKGPLS